MRGALFDSRTGPLSIFFICNSTYFTAKETTNQRKWLQRQKYEVCWSSCTIFVSSTRGAGFDSRIGPLSIFFVRNSTYSTAKETRNQRKWLQPKKYEACWSSGMLLVSGTRGTGFDSRTGNLSIFFFRSSTYFTAKETTNQRKWLGNDEETSEIWGLLV